MNHLATPGAVPLAEPTADLSALAGFARARTAGDFAFAELREGIISLALPPGTVLSRGALAARLGVSQTPVREALIRLQAEGLVAVVPQSATRVAPIDLGRAREAHFLRLAVEIEVARAVAARGAPAAALRALRAEAEAMAATLLDAAPGTALDADADATPRPDAANHPASGAAPAGADPGRTAAFAAADRRFHAALCDAAGMPGLWELVRGRSGHLDRLRRLHLPVPGKAAAILRDHAAILDALRARDPDAAAAAMRAHLSGTFAELEAIRAAHPRFF